MGKSPPKLKAMTLFFDQAGEEVERLDGALWPSIPTFIELADRRIGLVRNVRLKLTSSIVQIRIGLEVGPP